LVVQNWGTDTITLDHSGGTPHVLGLDILGRAPDSSNSTLVNGISSPISAHGDSSIVNLISGPQPGVIPGRYAQVGNLGLTASKEADLVNFLKILSDGFTKPNPVGP
jgi:hypothetical protein